MNQPRDKLLNIASELDELVSRGREPVVQEPLEQLRHAAEQVGKAWSGSWIGYHANVYSSGFRPTPPGYYFNPEWGLMSGEEGWKTFDPDVVKENIRSLAGKPDLAPAKEFNECAKHSFIRQKQNLLSIIEIESVHSASLFIDAQKEATDKLSLISEHGYLASRKPTQFTTRDSLAAHQGIWIPPHVAILAEVFAIKNTIRACESLVEIAKQIAAHTSRQQQRPQPIMAQGTRIFIGHGRSPVWRELKDFLEDKLGLLVDEFNRVPAAGVYISDRVLAMLDSAGIAFLVMTGEDEQPSGVLRPRENVVHEAGLFQGRLGFERAIVLLEDGCEKFSNNAGLGHIKFSKGNIRAAFQDVREVLEREGFLKHGALT